MINNHIRIALCAAMLAGLSIPIHSRYQCGHSVNALIHSIIESYFGKKHPEQSTASKHVADKVKNRPIREVSTNFEACYEESDIVEDARSGALLAVEKETYAVALNMTGSITHAHRIAAEIKNEAASIVHPSGMATYGCLSKFTGKALVHKVEDIIGQSEHGIQQKALEYLTLYASPFSQHTVDLNNITNLHQRIAQQDSSTAGNIVAISNIVAEKLRGTNPSTDAIKAETIRTAREHIRKSIVNKANALYHNDYKTERIVDTVLKEFDRECAYLRDYGISTAIVGKLAKFFGESLENKIKNSKI